MITVFTNIKDECRYLKQWIEYHINIGVEQFILFEDAFSQPHDDIIMEFNGKCNILLYKNQLLPNSTEYKDLTVFKIVFCIEHNITWGIKLDPDEYINLGKYKNIKEYISYCESKGVTEINMPWELHNANGLVYPPIKYNYNLRETYWRKISLNDINKTINNCSGAIYDVCKTFMNFNLFKERTIDVIQNNLYENFPHQLLKTSHPYNTLENDGVFIEHYITKSFDEFFKRLTVKGEHDPVWFRTIGDFFALNPDMIPYIGELEKTYDFDLSTMKTKLNVTTNGN